MRFAIFQYPLNNSAAIRMSGENVNLTSKGLDDKLDMLSGNTLDGFLHNMVAILVFDTFENIGLKFIDELSLLIRKDML